jgi:hypothetical protein
MIFVTYFIDFSFSYFLCILAYQNYSSYVSKYAKNFAPTRRVDEIFCRFSYLRLLVN